MLLIISPAKKLDDKSPGPVSDYTQPDHLDRAAELINVMSQKDSFEIADLMKLSMNLADLNMQRYQDWHAPFTPDNAKQALFTFTGDVYQGMDTATLTADDLAFAQHHLRILSGLYGILRPLDLMQAYRLEMGAKLSTGYGRNLYEFWGDTITHSINDALAAQGDDILINLASNEYFKSVNLGKLKGHIVTPVFKEYRKGAYRIISFNAKKARGYMSRFIIQNQLTHPDEIRAFNAADYAFNPDLSSSSEFVFSR